MASLVSCSTTTTFERHGMTMGRMIVPAPASQMEVDSKAELMKNIKLEGRNIGSARAMRWPEQ
jgi:hypothetical protein